MAFPDVSVVDSGTGTDGALVAPWANPSGFGSGIAQMTRASNRFVSGLGYQGMVWTDISDANQAFIKVPVAADVFFQVFIVDSYSSSPNGYGISYNTGAPNRFNVVQIDAGVASNLDGVDHDLISSEGVGLFLDGTHVRGFSFNGSLWTPIGSGIADTTHPHEGYAGLHTFDPGGVDIQFADFGAGNYAGGGGSPPVNTVLPVVTGTPEVGGLLVCDGGTWDPEAESLAYQWQRRAG